MIKIDESKTICLTISIKKNCYCQMTLEAINRRRVLGSVVVPQP